jgi:hypothetical protein
LPDLGRDRSLVSEKRRILGCGSGPGLTKVNSGVDKGNGWGHISLITAPPPKTVGAAASWDILTARRLRSEGWMFCGSRIVPMLLFDK